MNLTVSAPSLPELFQATAVTLTNEFIASEDIGEALREKLIIEGADPSRLLQEWVNRLLELMRIERMVFSSFDILEIKGQSPLILSAEVTGELIDPHRHPFLKKIIGVSCKQVIIHGATPYRADIRLE